MENRKRVASEFRIKAKEKGITFWRVHDCYMCGYSCGYLIDGDQVSYDSGCDCVRYGPVIRPASFDSIASNYNMQTNLKVIENMDKFWGFDMTTS